MCTIYRTILLLIYIRHSFCIMHIKLHFELTFILSACIMTVGRGYRSGKEVL